MLPGSNVSAPYKKLGAWAAKSLDTQYQALTDGFAVVNYTNVATDTSLVGFTDSVNPTTIIRQGVSTGGLSGSKRAGFNMPVKKGDYWKVTNTAGSPELYWLPMEP